MWIVRWEQRRALKAIKHKINITIKMKLFFLFYQLFVLFCILNSLALSTLLCPRPPLPEGGETQGKGECNKENKEKNVKSIPSVWACDKIWNKFGIKSKKAQKQYYHNQIFWSCLIMFFVLFSILNLLALWQCCYTIFHQVCITSRRTSLHYK